MIELVAALTLVAVAYVLMFLFGYSVALGHVERLLDIDEGEASPQLVPGFREGRRALSAEDIDRIDDWDRWE